MKEEQMILFARALSRCNLSEKDQEVLTAVAMTLSGHPDVFRACYIAFMNDEPSYHYHPMIGAPLEFFYEKELVRIRRLQEEVTLPRSVFIQYASYVDLCLSRIYPLGTVVELDRELLPKVVELIWIMVIIWTTSVMAIHLDYALTLPPCF